MERAIEIGGGRTRDAYTAARAVAIALVCALGYVLADLAAGWFRIPPAGIPMFLPAAGVGLAAALLRGPTGLAGVALGALIAGGFAPGPPGLRGSFAAALALGSASVIQAGTGAWWIHRRIGREFALETLSEVATFLCVAIPASCALGAGVYVVVLGRLGSLPAGVSPLEIGAICSIGATNGAILVTPVVLRFFASPRAVWQRRGAAFLLPLLIAVTLTGVLFQIVVRREDEQIRAHFGRTAESAGLVMSQGLVGYVDVLQALTGLFESSDFVTPKEFNTFVRRVLPSYGGILALQWAPVVRDAARIQFEADLGHRPLRSFSADAEELVPAGPSDVYVPIRYAEPAASNEYLVGLDLASEPARRSALFSAARSGRPRSTPPVKLLEGSTGVMVAAPISAKSQSGQALYRRVEGFIIGVLDPHLFVEDALSTSQGLWIVDRTTGKDLYRSAGFPIDEQPWYVAVYPFADRDWEIRFSPTAEYVAAMRSFYAPALLMSGLGFSGLLLAFLLVITGHAHRIEREVERRTKELASVNRALQFTNSRLKVSNDDLEEFARVVSHDLREPLRTIAGFSQLLMRRYGEQLDERGTEWLQHTVGGVYRLERLFDALHSYAQVGARSDEWSTVDLQVVLESVRKNLEYTIQSAGGALEAGPLPTVIGDARRIPLVLGHLIENGFRYRGEAPPRIHVASERKGDEWVITVSDNGVGIPEEFRDRVFDLFRRLESRTRTGAGVGLAYCRRVVERRGGAIWIDAVPGGGSAFSFSIPDARPESSDA